MQRWQEWNAEYFVLRAKSPKLELRDLMQHISESHTASSWPVGYEGRLQDWIDAGDPLAPPPFDDRCNIVSEGLFLRLQQLRRQLNGWMFWDERTNDISFAPEPEWQRIRAEQKAAAARRRRRWEDAQIQSERLQRRLSEVLALARADHAFWSALREWEQNREAKRPAKKAKGPIERLFHEQRGTGGAIVFRMATPEERSESNNPRMDPLFAQFFARVHEPGDVLAPRELVVSLRMEVRRELGYDHVFGWPGGPGIGEA